MALLAGEVMGDLLLSDRERRRTMLTTTGAEVVAEGVVGREITKRKGRGVRN